MRKRKPDPKIIRAGDKVRVVVPRFVLRVGYPKTVEDYLEDVRRQMGEEIDALFQKASGATGLVSHYTSVQPTKQRARVERELAYLLAKKDGFGGRERSIHFFEEPRWEGATFHVDSLRTAHTGIYDPPWGGPCGEFGTEWDYEPGGLANENRHRLVTLKTDGIVFGSWNTETFGAKWPSVLECPVYHLEKLT